MKVLSMLTILYMAVFSQIRGQNIQTSSFDKSLQQLTDVIALKLQPKIQQKMAVWDLSELNGDVSPIGKYIAEDISINLSDKFHIVNRNQLNTILKENKLKAEGFINQVTMKQIKKLSDIEILITGTVSVLADHIKITLQALDADGNIVAASKGEVPMNADVKELLGTNTGLSNRGFNRPLNSDEQVNNPGTVNSECQTKNTGDYCYMNSTSKKIQISFRQGVYGRGQIIVGPGQTQCCYDVQSGVYEYSVSMESSPGSNFYPMGYDYLHGQVKIETCQSHTLNIK